MTGWQFLFVALAGAACGVVNSIAGGGSLILFPVLMLTGMQPLDANVTNSVSTWAGYAGGVAGFRSELARHRRNLPRLLATTLAGSATGCVLLLVTPATAFDIIVPFLVLFGTLLTAFQPWIRSRLREPEVVDGGLGASALIGIFLATVYGGYFGGGLGVIVLAVLGLTVHDTLRNLNASKAAIALCAATVSVVVFGIFGPVHWDYVLVAAPSTLLGGYLGAAIARRLDENVLRIAVVIIGVAAALYLFLKS